jgi:hypothetical protein
VGGGPSTISLPFFEVALALLGVLMTPWVRMSRNSAELVLNTLCARLGSLVHAPVPGGILVIELALAPEGLPSGTWFGPLGEDGGELEGEEEEDHDRISGLVPDVEACSVRSVILARGITCAPCTM